MRALRLALQQQVQERQPELAQQQRQEPPGRVRELQEQQRA
jgi:hypothetical protein